MRHMILVILASLAASPYATAEPTATRLPNEVTITAPGEKVAFLLSARPDIGPTFSLTLDDRKLLADCPLGLLPRDADPLGPKLAVTNARTRLVNETWTPAYGTQSPVQDRHRLAEIDLAEPGDGGRALGLAVRVYDDGIAFRYRLPGSGKQQLEGERTAFRFAEAPKAYALPLQGFRTAYEGKYKVAPLSDLGDSLLGLPLTLEFPGGAWAAISEADLTDYAGLYLATTRGEPNVLTARLSARGKDAAVVRTAPFDSPWRVILLGRKPGDLITSQIILNCNPPSAIADTSWIRPGKVTWDWWPKQMANGVDFTPGINTATMKHYATFAAEAGFDYLLIDEGWSWWQNQPGKDGKPVRVTDITRTVPEINLPEILDHCRRKGVRVWLWLTWSHCAAQMKEAFPLYEKWGIAGVKIDFMMRDDQWMVNWYQQVAELAAKHHLMVDMHGSYKPTGMERTWPNMLTREGVLGMECCKWSSDVTPEHNLTLPFTRMLAGPMDYTPGGFNVSTPDRFKPRDSAPFVMGTRCHQLAQFVVYYSPLQMCVDYPEGYRGAVGFDFLRWVPTTWDESVVLDGYPGRFIAMARRKRDAWYLGCMNNMEPRMLRIPLSFLGNGTFRADIFADGERAKEVPEHIRRSRRTLVATDTLDVAMAPGGGLAARLRPDDGQGGDEKPIRHLVAFSFTPDFTPAQKQELLDAFDRLRGCIPEIAAYERGTNVGDRSLAQGREQAVLMRFESRRDLRAYVAHPAHREFAAKYLPWLRDLLVLDWEAAD